MTKTNLLLPSFTVINISVDLNNCLFLAHISMPKLEKFFLSLELISSTFCLYHTKTYPHHNSSRKYVPTKAFHHPSIKYRPRFFDQVGHQTTYASMGNKISSLNSVIVRPTKIMNRANKNWAPF